VGDATAKGEGGNSGGTESGGGEGFSPVRIPAASFAALATLLRASLDQAASDREFLQARNCLVTSALFAVDGAEYVSWLREQGAAGAGAGAGGAGADSVSSAVMADSELVSAAGRLDEAAAAPTGAASGDGAGTGAGAGADYLLLRELRRHPVWRTIELWEVSMSDSVVMAMEGGGARVEKWLPGSVLVGLEEVREALHADERRRRWWCYWLVSPFDAAAKRGGDLTAAPLSPFRSVFVEGDC